MCAPCLSHLRQLCLRVVLANVAQLRVSADAGVEVVTAQRVRAERAQLDRPLPAHVAVVPWDTPIYLAHTGKGRVSRAFTSPVQFRSVHATSSMVRIAVYFGWDITINIPL